MRVSATFARELPAGTASSSEPRSTASTAGGNWCIRTARKLVIACILVSAAARAHGIVDASLQPNGLFDRHRTVLGLRVAEIDEEKMTIVLEVISRPKGEFQADKFRLAVAEDGPVDAFYELIPPGQQMVAYVDPVVKRGRGEKMLFYAADGHWGIAEKRPDADGPLWQWTTHLEPGTAQSMLGVFNGKGQRLVEMMEDAGRGHYYFPAQPFTRFGEGRALARLPSAAKGLALSDLNADGTPDVLAASPDGCRLLLQTGPWTFADRTTPLGLSDARGRSVSVADVNDDGRRDLLIGTALYLAAPGGKFEPGRKPAAGDEEDVKVAAFVQINADGWPDVVVSRGGRGLAILLHDGTRQARYTDATASLGLKEIEACRTGDGFFAPGDWNGDGRCDLFYAVGNGLMLIQDAKGRFAPLPHRLRFSFETGGGAGRTGAGCMASLWRPGATDLIFATEASVHFVIAKGDRLIDAGGYGNEITEAEMGLVGALAEDLNADGNVDVYAINDGQSANIFYMNRGYGSFMTPRKYGKSGFPNAHRAGAHSAAAGDIDGDGANDLVLGLPDGSIVVLPNRTLDQRGKSEHPNTHEKARAAISILSVRLPAGRGTLGAEVVLRHSDRGVVARRRIGADVLTGCRGPDVANLAVREPGEYELRVRYADGANGRWAVDLTRPGQLRKLTASRDGKIAVD